MVAGTFTHGAISLVLCRMFSYVTTISLEVVTLGNMWHFVGPLWSHWAQSFASVTDADRDWDGKKPACLKDTFVLDSEN